MQRPDATDLVDINSPLHASTKNAPMPKQKQDATAWETCLAESKDTKRYPRVPVIDGPFQGFEEMLDAKEHGNYNIGMWILSPETLFLSFFIISLHPLPTPSQSPPLTTPPSQNSKPLPPPHRPNPRTHHAATEPPRKGQTHRRHRRLPRRHVPASHEGVEGWDGV